MSRDPATPLDLIKLPNLMARTSGIPDIKIGLIDGPIFTQHPDLTNEYLHEIPDSQNTPCTRANSTACLHGTFIAGILFARRGSVAPAICPGCTLLIRPIFTDTTFGREQLPSAAPEELAAAMVDCMDAGARIINLSLGLAHPSNKGEQTLENVIHEAVRRRVIVVAAAGNQGTLGSSAITRHPWVIPVVACDLSGRPTNESNLGNSIGRRGLSAPGEKITSLGAEGKPIMRGGTSAAVPFVTGTIALLWSEFPFATATQIKLALTQAALPRRASVVPPLLNAATAYNFLKNAATRGQRV